MDNKIEAAVQELMQENGVDRTEALFILLCKVGLQYVEAIQGENDRGDTIEMVVETLEENLHEV